MKRKQANITPSADMLEAAMWVNRTFTCLVNERIVDEVIPTQYTVTARRACEEYGGVWVHYDRQEVGKPVRQCMTPWPVFRDRYVNHRIK